eukprot:6236928-Amphidinium_carterae.1
MVVLPLGGCWAATSSHRLSLAAFTEWSALARAFMLGFGWQRPLNQATSPIVSWPGLDGEPMKKKDCPSIFKDCFFAHCFRQAYMKSRQPIVRLVVVSGEDRKLLQKEYQPMDRQHQAANKHCTSMGMVIGVACEGCADICCSNCMRVPLQDREPALAKPEPSGCRVAE